MNRWRSGALQRAEGLEKSRKHKKRKDELEGKVIRVLFASLLHYFIQQVYCFDDNKKTLFFVLRYFNFERSFKLDGAILKIYYGS